MDANVSRRSAIRWAGAALSLPVAQFKPSQLEIGRMAFTPKCVDLVRNVATVTGTGPVTLGAAVNGYSSLAGAVAAGEQFYYCIQGVDKPAEREIGRGTMQADGRVARQAIAGALTSFTGGTKTIALVAAAEWFATLDQLAGSAASWAASRSELAAKQPGTGGTMLLGERGREGLFQFDASDLSAKVAADKAQGIYVAPASDPDGSSGAWVRKFEGPVDPRWWGLVEGNANGANGAANSAALSAMFATLRARAANAANVSANYQGGETIRFPIGHFEFASTIDLTGGTFILEGGDTGHASARGTILKFPAGTTGIRTQRFDTSGASATDGTTHKGGDGAIIRNLSLIGGYAGTEAEAHGIHLRSRATIENFYIEGFEGDGIHADTSASEGNTNNTRVRGGRIQNCRNGMFLNGPDSNIWTVESVDVSGNRQWGVWDSSFLGNSYFGLHAAKNGVSKSGSPSAAVSHGGNRYSVVAGQEAGASTNAPSGNTADNSWWYYQGAGKVHENFPAWVSGTAYRAGGSYRADNSNGRSVFVGCYHESGQGQAQIESPSIVIGGMLANSVNGTGAVLSSESGGVLGSTRGFQATFRDQAGTRKAILGEANQKGTIFKANDSVVAPDSYRLKFNYASNDLQFDYQNSNSLRLFLISGPRTIQQFGTGAAVAHAFYPAKLMVGDTASNARLMSNGTAAPTKGAHGAGEIVWNRTPASGQPMGWVCSVAGTPGTWLPLANVP